MNCEQRMDDMQRYVDHDLTYAEEASLQAHMEQCPDCATSFEQLKQLSAALSSLPMVYPQFNLVDSILPKLAELDARQDQINVAYLPKESKRRKIILPWKIGSGFVAAAVIFSLVMLNLQPSTQYEASDVPMSEAAALKSTVTDTTAESEGMGAKSSNKEISEPDNEKVANDNNANAIFNEKQTVETVPPLSPTPVGALSGGSEGMDKPITVTSSREENPQNNDDKVEIKQENDSNYYLKDNQEQEKDETAAKSQELAPQPSMAPLFASSIDDNTNSGAPHDPAIQTLPSDDGHMIGVVEHQIVQVQTPDGNRLYISIVQWKATDTIRLVQWQDNQRLIYEVSMEDGQLKRYIMDPILKTEQELIAN